MEKVSKNKRRSPLHSVLLRACPPDENGSRSIPLLAAKLGTSYQNIYGRWIDQNRIPQHWVHQILLVADGRVSMEDLLPFVFKERERQNG